MKGVDYGNYKTDASQTAGETALVSPADKPRTLRYTQPYMRGNDVKMIQERLNALGFKCGATDGIFGKKTQSGVKAFQASHGLVVDGIVGVKTRDALAKHDA